MACIAQDLIGTRSCLEDPDIEFYSGSQDIRLKITHAMDITEDCELPSGSRVAIRYIARRERSTVVELQHQDPSGRSTILGISMSLNPAHKRGKAMKDDDPVVKFARDVHIDPIKLESLIIDHAA